MNQRHEALSNERSMHKELYSWVKKFYPQERENIYFLIKLYQAADKQIGDLKAVTGLKCAANCGRCCEKNDIETTVLELLPLAVYLWIKKEALGWLERIYQAKGRGVCVFYQPGPLVKGNEGRCSIYCFRPLICRLFGFSAGKDKYGRQRLVTCADMKRLYPDAYGKARTCLRAPACAPRAGKYTRGQKFMGEKSLVPNMTDFTFQITAAGSDLGIRQVPINEAVKIALERTGLNVKLRKCE